MRVNDTIPWEPGSTGIREYENQVVLGMFGRSLEAQTVIRR